MPKSPRSSPSTANSKPSGDDAHSRLTDIALRKKKNADAQAAFRARRANYIATLEETVTSLESVVLQLQESWRESRAELQDARQEILRLQHQCRERDRFWRNLWENRRGGPTPDTDISSSSPSFSPLHSHPNGLGAQMGNHPLASYSLDGMAYRSSDDNSTSQSTYAGQQDFPVASAHSLAFNEGDVSGDGSHCLSQRVEKVNHSYSVSGSANRAARWTSVVHATADDCSPATATHPQTCAFTEPPALTNSQMTYIPRFPNDDPKLALGNFEAASFAFSGDRFPESRSLSPTSTPSSSSSTSISSASYSYTFPDPALAQDNFRRSSHNAEMTLHGGTADISVVPGADAVRYRLGSRQPVPMPDRPMLPLTRPGSVSESQHEPGSSDGDCASYSNSRLRSRRSIPLRSSRSPSPGAPALSCTVAVIKAQAFGALRRTRTRTKKSTESAARVAMDVLEARGIGISPTLGHRRRGSEDDDDDLDTTQQRQDQ